MAGEESQSPKEQRLTYEEFKALPAIDFVTLGMFIIGESETPLH